MKGNKILYLMHVDWGWIKQRPHIVAEKLAERNKLKVFYMFSRKRKNITNNPTPVENYPLIALPLKRIKLIKWLNRTFLRILFFIIMFIYRPNMVWVTHPTMYSYLPKTKFLKYKLVYDCMDDILAFENTIEAKNDLNIFEQELFNHSDLVFVSSANLQNEIVQRGCYRDKTRLIRNGYNGEIIKNNVRDNSEKVNFQIGYVGTISNWLDFDLVLYSLEKLNDIEYHFYGPIDCKVPQHERIYYYGSINHSELYETIKFCDVLSMPFKLNDLILSVDPVKLYEYINFEKNIISVYYPELNRFEEFVHFYTNKNDYVKVIESMINNNKLKYTDEQKSSFLINNTWDYRVNLILEELNQIQ